VAEIRSQKDQNPICEDHEVGFEYDLGKQVTQIDNFIAAGVDLILLNPGDAERAVGCQRSRKPQTAGIIVVARGYRSRRRPTPQ